RHLRTHPRLDLADVAYTLQIGRRAFPYRRAIVVNGVEAASQALEALLSNRAVGSGPTPTTASVAFLFPGQGAQYVGMGRDLYEQLPVFRATVDACAEQLRPMLGLDLRDVLYPASGVEDGADRLRQTAIAQPALFTIELALARQLESWGI